MLTANSQQLTSDLKPTRTQCFPKRPWNTDQDQNKRYQIKIKRHIKGLGCPFGTAVPHSDQSDRYHHQQNMFHGVEAKDRTAHSSTAELYLGAYKVQDEPHQYLQMRQNQSDQNRFSFLYITKFSTAFNLLKTSYNQEHHNQPSKT